MNSVSVVQVPALMRICTTDENLKRTKLESGASFRNRSTRKSTGMSQLRSIVGDVQTTVKKNPRLPISKFKEISNLFHMKFFYNIH
ncbi:hypothetical protein EG68_01149 [Paragonimus skrjabini miyazakii]|uniref:Uncharacterized protein n=1 Tax=Paragonimus skrjabini miyazakii TaxID=59628 RepID=A0A8S9Z8B8_9TREM|nr:hypothetical protein EG68_01149 [Paragonimus skrjabini miyazakii]